MTHPNVRTPRLAALQYRDFRLLWFGQLVSTIGSQMQLIAVNWHVYESFKGDTYTPNFLEFEFDLGAGALGLGTLGWMTSVNMIFFMGGPQLGEVEAGLVAAAFGASFAIVTGGLATVLLTGWVAWKYPRLRNYTTQSAEV